MMKGFLPTLRFCDHLDPAVVESPMSGGGGPLVPTQLNWCMQAELVAVTGPLMGEAATISV